ncbi:hypothetical protein ACSS6W_005306 [Trichoderma asperelloides]
MPATHSNVSRWKLVQAMSCIFGIYFTLLPNCKSFSCRSNWVTWLHGCWKRYHHLLIAGIR